LPPPTSFKTFSNTQHSNAITKQLLPMPATNCIITKKLTKTNGLTDKIFLLVIFTDENNYVSKFVRIYRQRTSVGDTVSIYRQNTSVSIYRPYRWRTIQFVWKVATVWWRGFFSDDFTDGMTEGYLYSDVALSPAELLMGIQTKMFRW